VTFGQTLDFTGDLPAYSILLSDPRSVLVDQVYTTV